MYSDQLYRRNGPFSGSSPDSIIGLSSYRGCLTGSSLVPMTTREADEELPPEPQPASSPPAAAVPAISLNASRRDMGRRQGDLSLGWNAISIYLLSSRPLGPPPLPLGRELLQPGASFLSPTARRVGGEAQLLGRRVQTHLVDQLAADGGIVQQALKGEPVHERGEVRREALRVTRCELAGPLPLSDHLRDRRAPSLVERLALAGRLVVAQRPRPQLDPQRPILVCLAPLDGRTRELYQPHQLLGRTLDAGQLAKGLDVKEVLGVGQRLGEDLLLRAEVVHHQRRTQSRSLRDIGDAGVAQTPLPDHLHRRLQH